MGLPFIVVIITGTLIFSAQGGFWRTYQISREMEYTGQYNPYLAQQTEVLQSRVSPAAIYLATTLLMVLISVFYRIFYARWYWTSAVVLAAIYAYGLTRAYGNISFFLMFIPVLFYNVMISILMVGVFFNRSLLRFRTLIAALGGAIVFVITMRLIYAIIPIPGGITFNVVNRFIDGLYLFIFIGVGISLSDTILYKMEIKELRRQEDDNGEDEDLD